MAGGGEDHAVEGGGRGVKVVGCGVGEGGLDPGKGLGDIGLDSGARNTGAGGGGVRL